MCAAPGSKTAQLIEFLHKDEEKIPGIVSFQYIMNEMCSHLKKSFKNLNNEFLLH